MKTRARLHFRAVASVIAACLLLGAQNDCADFSDDLPGSFTQIRVEADQPLGPIGDLYNVGYNGWGDIINPGMVRAFDEIGIKYCRIRVDLKKLCGAKPGDYQWNQISREDEGLNLLQRVQKIIANGWTPLLAFSFHGSDNDIPLWFKGSNNDNQKDAWTHYNLDGTLDPKGDGNQLAAATTLAKDIATHFASAGLTGLCWETIYEMDGTDPLVEIHHAVALGIREADPTARIVGPATWPGWSVEERFVKPYLKKYGPDLLDMVSVHWYASCDHGFWKLKPGLKEGKTIMTMADRDLMTYLMNETPDYGTHVSSLNHLLQDQTLNPQGKKIGIIFTEADVNATSYYHRNPVNPAWPNYSARSDCWQNDNYFGGVWWASMLCHVAATGTGADVCKFNTRNFWGVQEGVPTDRAYRYPIWFAMKLLQDACGLRAGRQMLDASASGGGAPLVEAFATGSPDDVGVIVINKSFDPQRADVTVSGLTGGQWQATCYLFDQARAAAFLGAKPGDRKGDGNFQGFPDDDAISQQSLKPVGTMTASASNGAASFREVNCPPVSFVVLKLARKS